MTRPGHVGGLRAHTPLRVAGEKLLHARVADVQGAQALTARRLDPKTVHDLRVACRRLRAAVKVFGKKRLRQLDGRIEHLQDALGELRDLQLEAKWLSRHGADARRTRGRLAKAEAHVRISVALWTRRSEPLVLRALIHRRASGTLGGRRTRKRLRKRLLDLEEKLAQPDPLDADAAHRIRIAAKKLRYEAELLRGAYDLAEAIDLLTGLQSALGELHDADVRLATVRANPRLARAARDERRRSATQARRIVLRAKRLCPRLRRERL